MGAGLHQTMALAAIINFFIPVSVTIDPNCDYYQELSPGTTYYVYNPEYPNNYGPSTACRWVAVSAINTNIVLTCDDIDIPPSNQCTGDRLAVSLSGNVDLSDVHNYCGKGTITVVSNSNSLALGLFSTPISEGGKFLCSITSVDSGVPTTTAAPTQCDCGWKMKTRIVGGHETGVNEYPAMAGLIDLETKSYHCGGTILSSKYVLSAAHCVSSKQASNIAVLVGDHDLTTGTDTPYSELYTVEKLIVHPDFDETTLANDIALVKTVNEILFSAFVGPICLPFRYSTESFVGRTVTALGWGSAGFSEPMSDTLQEVDLDVVDTSYCASMIPDRPVTRNQICTYGDGKDTCQHDSGGPILWMDPGTQRLHLVGITSYGVDCATDEPSVNTRVTNYLVWIANMASDTSYCIK